MFFQGHQSVFMLSCPSSCILCHVCSVKATKCVHLVISIVMGTLPCVRCARGITQDRHKCTTFLCMSFLSLTCSKIVKQFYCSEKTAVGFSQQAPLQVFTTTEVATVGYLHRLWFNACYVRTLAYSLLHLDAYILLTLQCALHVSEPYPQTVVYCIFCTECFCMVIH